MPSGYDRKSRRNYSTLTKFPRRKAEKRLKSPGVPKRPIRFQVRSLIDKDFLRPNDWKFILHRRGPEGRTFVGLNPLEMRAIPHEELRGTLPERIIYKYLRDVMRFVPDIDFDFQSSLQGGRLDTGGIVADFLFPFLRVVINPLGPTHGEYWRFRKDEEQISALEELGYQVYMIEERDVYDEQKLEWWMRRIFNWVHTGSMDTVQSYEPGILGQVELDSIMDRVLHLQNYLRSFRGSYA
jgi:very-short-patch-repair endonuclease